MTRLIDDWIRDIKIDILEKEKDLLKKSGLNYVYLGAAASGSSIEKIQLYMERKKVAVVPITTGLGIISTFSESVKAIIEAMGFSSFVTEKTDVAGIYEATLRDAEIIFLADDERFLAINIAENKVAENNFATAAGYVSALEAVCGGVSEKEILIIGYGPVGQEMVKAVEKKGAFPVIYDSDEKVQRSLKSDGYEIIEKTELIRNYEFILDATNTGGWLTEDMLNPKVWIITPGVPISLTEGAYQKHKDRVIHDYLPIGVAAMMAMVCI